MPGLPRRAAGWLLALALNLLFYMLVLAPRPLRHAVAPARWAAPVWLVQVPVSRRPVAAIAVPARTPLLRKVTTPARAQAHVPAILHPPAFLPPLSTPATADAGQTFTAQPGERTIRDAVRATLAEAGPAPPPAMAPGKYQVFASQLEQASTPGCLGADALKHDPPKIPGTAIALKGLLVLPHLAHAALTGKCR